MILWGVASSDPATHGRETRSTQPSRVAALAYKARRHGSQDLNPPGGLVVSTLASCCTKCCDVASPFVCCEEKVEADRVWIWRVRASSPGLGEGPKAGRGGVWGTRGEPTAFTISASNNTLPVSTPIQQPSTSANKMDSRQRRELKARLTQTAVTGLQHYLIHRTLYQRAMMAAFTAYVLKSTYDGLKPRQKRSSAGSAAIQAEGQTEPARTGGVWGGKGGKRVEVDALFFARLKRLLRIVIPSWKSREASLLLIHTCFLIARTILSLYVAALDGSIVS